MRLISTEFLRNVLFGGGGGKRVMVLLRGYIYHSSIYTISIVIYLMFMLSKVLMLKVLYFHLP